jgi:hypothetical protein
MLLDPVIRQTVEQFVEAVARPGVFAAEIQIARHCVVVTKSVHQMARFVPQANRLSRRIFNPPDAVILLATLAAKDQRQQHPRPIARHELLTMEREVAFVLVFQGRVNGITTRDKLVQPKGERRAVRERLVLAAITGL